jgi:hypothetical protein
MDATSKQDRIDTTADATAHRPVACFASATGPMSARPILALMRSAAWADACDPRDLRPFPRGIRRARVENVAKTSTADVRRLAQPGHLKLGAFRHWGIES